MIQLVLDPRIFNYVIMGLYVLNVLRWGVNWLFFGGRWGDPFYWLAALAITVAVTFGMGHKA